MGGGKSVRDILALILMNSSFLSNSLDRAVTSSLSCSLLSASSKRGSASETFTPESF